MISGQVKSDYADGAGLEALIPIDIVNSIGAFRTLEAVVDTGFSGALSLPESSIVELSLDYRGDRPITLADGQTHFKRTYLASLLWHG